jgi:hypothetical protein
MVAAAWAVVFLMGSVRLGRYLAMRRRPVAAQQAGALPMISHQNGLLSSPVTAGPSEAEALRERERLRRELLKRIINEETRRQSSRGTSR